MSTPPLSLTAIQHRTFTLATRATISEGEGYTFTAIGFPYDVETEISPGFFESFAPGCARDEEAHLAYQHQEPIGLLTERADVPEGRRIQARISPTQRGTDTAILVRDGVLKKMSVGFFMDEYTETRDKDGVHIRHTSINVVEYSVVDLPAHPTAAIQEVRHKEGTPLMDTNTTPTTDVLTRDDLTPINEAINDLEREVKATRHALSASPAQEIQFRSFGEYVKAYAAGEEVATRTFEGTTQKGHDINRPAWLGVLDKRMAAKMTLTNLFTHTTDLPAKGSHVAYAQRKEAPTITVTEQANEGDDLPVGKTWTYEEKTTPVKTYGGGGNITFQVIDRAEISLLDDLFADEAFEYASRIETATRTLFKTTVTAAEASPVHTFADLASLTVDDLNKAVLKLIDEYDKTPYLFDGILVSGEVFEVLANLDKDPKALQFTSAPEGHQGTITLPKGHADYANIPVIRIPNWSGKHFVGYSREAIKIQESPGAPFRLQDTNILNLSKLFSVYGYAAHFAPKPTLIKAVSITG